MSQILCILRLFFIDFHCQQLSHVKICQVHFKNIYKYFFVIKRVSYFLQELVTNRWKIGPFQIEEMKNYFQMYGRVFHVSDNTIFNKVAAIMIKFLKELVTNGWKTGISFSKWMEE